MLSLQPQAIPQRTHIPLHVEDRDRARDVELNEACSRGNRRPDLTDLRE